MAGICNIFKESQVRQILPSYEHNTDRVAMCEICPSWKYVRSVLLEVVYIGTTI